MSTIATQIREAAYARVVKAMKFKSTRKIPFPILQADEVPALGVFILREELAADGDENVSVPRFLGDVTIGFSVLMAGNPDLLEGALDGTVDQIEDTLLSDPSFVALVDGDGNALIEGFTRLSRSYVFPRDGDTYYGEARLELGVRIRCNFPPVTPIDLLEVDVTDAAAANIPGAATPNLKLTLPGA